jgi:hypothetical protein
MEVVPKHSRGTSLALSLLICTMGHSSINLPELSRGPGRSLPDMWLKLNPHTTSQLCTSGLGWASHASSGTGPIVGSSRQLSNFRAQSTWNCQSHLVSNGPHFPTKSAGKSIYPMIFFHKGKHMRCWPSSLSWGLGDQGLGRQRSGCPWELMRVEEGQEFNARQARTTQEKEGANTVHVAGETWTSGEAAVAEALCSSCSQSCPHSLAP